jgi:SPP1 gp7 family putative phage head morphogenesis protein
MQEALDYWKSKVPLSSREFYDLAEASRVNAFTVSGVAKMDMIVQIQESLGKVLSEGLSFGQWKESIADIIHKLGWTGQGRRLGIIFRTNIQTAYSVGRWKQMQAVKALRPYWQYSAVNDSRTRPVHRALDKKVFPADHPFWKTFYPPNGHRCRCTVKSLSARQVKERGLEVETEDPTGKLFEPIDERGNKLPAELLMPDRGFEVNPALEHYKPDLSLYPAHLKQRFLDNLVQGVCPDDWMDFAESKCYARLKKYLKQSDLKDMETLVWAEKQGGVSGYGDWVRGVLESGRANGEVYPVGNLPAHVLNKLEAHPRLALVVMEDTQALHLGLGKHSEQAVLTVEEVASIPQQFQNARWFVDMDDPALLMTWVRIGSKWVKVVIKTDRKVGRGVANKVVTAGVVEDYNITADPRFKEI